MTGTLKTRITFANPTRSDIPNLKKLWIQVFGDESAAVDLFFEKIFSADECFCARLGGEIAAMLFLIPCEVCNKKAHYVYAACTAPGYRKNGVMGKLLQFALQSAEKKGDSFSVLLPANEKLYDYYGKFGYLSAAKICRKYVAFGEKTPLSKKASAGLTVNYSVDFRKKAFKNINYVAFGQNVLDFAMAVNEIYFGKNVCCEYGCALVSAQRNSCREITEIASDNGDFKDLMQVIKRECPADEYILRMPVNSADGENCEKFGMIKPLDGSEVPQNLYIGITLD